MTEPEGAGSTTKGGCVGNGKVEGRWREGPWVQQKGQDWAAGEGDQGQCSSKAWVRTGKV